MKIVVVGGTGLVGSKLVTALRGLGHDVLVASPNSGVNTYTGEGVGKALDGADVVVDLANSPSFEDAAVMDFFETAGRNLLAAEKRAGVRHHVALTVVGADTLPDSGYLRAKIAQERLVKESGIPYTILRSTQFFEFLERIADSLSSGTLVMAPPALMQPVASDDVVAALTELVTGPAANATFEVAGPTKYQIDSLITLLLESRGDSRSVASDPHARYFGAELTETSLLPTGGKVRIGVVRLEPWLQLSSAVSLTRATA